MESTIQCGAVALPVKARSTAPGRRPGSRWRRRRASRVGGAVLATVAACLLLAGCGARPQQAVGVSRGPTVHYLLCPGDRVHTARLTTPGGRALWQFHSDAGSKRTTYRVDRPLPPGPIRVSDPSGRPAMEFSRLPASGILRGDGKVVTAAQFAAGRSSYCGSVREDRATGVALGFVFLVLAGIFVHRWLRARRSRDPFRRGYR